MQLNSGRGMAGARISAFSVHCSDHYTWCNYFHAGEMRAFVSLADVHIL